jgi:glycosyltransferase involved in cell wall biosynthesis
MRRVLFVGATRYTLPLQGSLARKWAALEEELDLRVLARGTGNGDERFHLTLPGNGLRCQLAMSGQIARELRDFDPDVVLAQGPFDAASALVARRRAGWRGPIVCDIHGNWRASTRLYGSRLRGLASYPAQLVAWLALKRVDAIRTLSAYTSGLVRAYGREPLAEFPAYVDLTAFSDRPPAPLPAHPQAAFVGVLEPYKGLRVLKKAWKKVHQALPDARLAMVGRGHRSASVERFVAASEGSVTWVPRLENAAIGELLDQSTCLVLPSRSEGLPRIVMESFCRGRPVVATSVGGVPDLVVDGVNGMLVKTGDSTGLAEALIRVLGDPTEAQRLAAGAAATDGPWRATPEDFAARTSALVEAALARA